MAFKSSQALHSLRPCRDETPMAFSATLSSPPGHCHPRPQAQTSSLHQDPRTPPLQSDSAALAVLGGSSIAAVAAALVLADPEKRRQLQAEEVGGGDKEVVREYFNNNGFSGGRRSTARRMTSTGWVQLDIRLGHAKTVENVLKMLKDEGSLEGVSVCDAGCGIGSLAIPLAKEGAVVSASDISAAMVAEAERQAREEKLPTMPKFEVKDLESLEGKYDTVVCLDVLIHYPQSKADAMIAHLAGVAERRLPLSFAPKTIYYDLLKRVGELFPGPSKATRAYLHAEADVERALAKVRWRIRKRELITTQFYFSRSRQCRCPSPRQWW